ncbi:MAG: hypothetical protein A3F72_02960 [Bacteroidetes bacterium RIFCSPLOWO2_12_FULL_35_15]|nr:MAG: hypothetical protein A3F72_02960 [Bacteroidetes bacterium RIFCSPLOWO2_12_FULL_35_15]
MIVTKEKNASAPKMEASTNGKNGLVTVITKPLNEVIAEEKKVSAIDRIKKAEQFEILAKRHEVLTDKKSQLAKFIIADDGTQGCTIVFKSGMKSFEIANNGVIKELLTYAKVKLDSLIDVSEAEVLSFVI